MVGYIIITLLPIVLRVCLCKNFENRSLIGKDMDKSKVPCFYGPPCTLYCIGSAHGNDVAFGELPGATDASNTGADPLHTGFMEGQRAYVQSSR